jgi:multiple sugar transport system permease protein
VPLCVLVIISFTRYELGDLDIRFVGLANFSKALGDPVFRRSLFNTLLYMAIVLPWPSVSACSSRAGAWRKRTRSFYEWCISCR